MFQMPDTTTAKHTIGKGWYTIRMLALLITPLALGLTLFASSLGAQGSSDLDCSDFDSPEEAQAVFDRNPSDPNRLDRDGDGLACEAGGDDGGRGETEDIGAGEDQYASDDTQETTQGPIDSNGQPLRQSPSTGGVPLLPVGAGLVAWSLVGLSLLRRRT